MLAESYKEVVKLLNVQMKNSSPMPDSIDALYNVSSTMLTSTLSLQQGMELPMR